MQSLFIGFGSACMAIFATLWPRSSTLSLFSATPSLIFLITALFFYLMAARPKQDPLKYFDRFCDRKLKKIELLLKNSDPKAFDKKFKSKKPEGFAKGYKAFLKIGNSCTDLEKRMGQGIATALKTDYSAIYQNKDFFHRYPNGEFPTERGLKKLKKYIFG